MSNHTGTLYIVATPLGNLEDLSPRARRVLGEVSTIAAEDTRHSRGLLTRFGITTSLVSCHDHNERACVKKIVDSLLAGGDVALISDAGTPLISDPGYRLVRAAHDNGIRIVPIPGPSALICALSAAGLPTDRFVFEGYAPEKAQARRKFLKSLKTETRTLVLYEAPHRIMDLLEDAIQVFGPDRRATVARELTKKFETIKPGTLGEIREWMTGDPDQRKGEFVVLFEGAPAVEKLTPLDIDTLLETLLEELPLKKAAAVAAKLTGLGKNALYEQGLKMQGRKLQP